MKILLINNYTKLLDKLISQIEKIRQVDVIDLKQLKNVNLDDYNAIILSGGSYLQVEGHDREYSKEIKIIKNTNKPLLGICLGFELIAHSYNEKLEKLNQRELGNILMIESIEDPIFNNLKNPIEVHECHRWVIKKINNLKVLGKSKDGIEVIKHPSKLIYGVQFHPEVFVEGSHGEKIIKNFIDLI